MKELITFDDFNKVDIRVGEIVAAEFFENTRMPAYKVWVDFGDAIGIKKSSAQITACYVASELVGKQVLCVVNFPPKHIKDFMSEVLILGIYAAQGVVLIQPQQPVKRGDILG